MLCNVKQFEDGGEQTLYECSSLFPGKRGIFLEELPAQVREGGDGDALLEGVAESVGGW